MKNRISSIRNVFVWLLMASLVACGGGGGSAGTTVGVTPSSKVTTVALVASAASIVSSGADGTEVTLTAIVKDANNNGLAGETVDFKADSGSISNTNRKSGADGTVVEKLSVKGDTSLRTITITANVGGVSSAPVKVQVVLAAASKVAQVVLVASSGTMLRSGADGTEVTLTAIAKDANNNVMVGETVSFTASSGTISTTNRKTDANGQVVEKLSTKGDTSLRTITVTANVGTVSSLPVQVQVVDAPATKAAFVSLVASAASIVNSGADGTEVTLTAIVKDANNNVLVGETVDFKADSGTISNTSRVTGADGRVVEKLSVKGDASIRTIKITASSGAIVSSPVLVNVVSALPAKATKITLVASASSILASGLDGTEVVLTAILRDASNNLVSGETVSFNASSGNVTNTVRISGADGAVTEKLSVKGDPTIRTITLTASTGSLVSAPVQVKVVSALPTKVASIILLTSSDSLAASGVDGSEVTLTAIVKDAFNNVVAGETVDFVATSGTVSSTKRISDANGMVVEKLSTKGDPSLRTIFIYALAGGVSSQARSVAVVGSTAETVQVVLATNSEQLQSGGKSLGITVLVKDAANNLLKGATVNLSASSGELTYTNKVTDDNGAVTASLSTLDGTPRTITLTATSGASLAVTKQVQVVVATPTLLVTADKSSLPSNGASGTEATILALVRDANNAVVANSLVNFSADSGALSATSAVTDAKGVASVKLGTAADPTSRNITVTVKVAGAPAKTIVIPVSGTSISVTASKVVNLGSSTTLTVTLVDSANTPLSGRTISYTSVVNPLNAATSGTAVTGPQGTVSLEYTANAGTSDVISVSAMGVSTTHLLSINATNYTIYASEIPPASPPVLDPTPITQGSINLCYQVNVRNTLAGVAQAGTVNISSSRGAVYSNNVCTVPLTTAITLDIEGRATAFMKATGPGDASLTSITDKGATVQNALHLVAPLTAGSIISLQADPSVVGTSDSNGQNQTTLRALVQDAATQGNVVEGALVAFSIVTDPSGGFLSQPSVARSNAAGIVTVNYSGGATPTALGGVVIKAQVQEQVSSASTTTGITVAKKALFITAGTGATVTTPSAPTYQTDYAVIVTDAAGNPVSGVTVTGSVRPKKYYKGFLKFVGTAGPWTPQYSIGSPPTGGCSNEDTDFDGVFRASEDVNGNGRLDPGIPVTVTSSGKTDANGSATLSLFYPRDRSNWLDIELTVTGTVAGTEARYVAYAVLPGLSSDFNNSTITPPGFNSPYGTSATCTDTN